MTPFCALRKSLLALTLILTSQLRADGPLSLSIETVSSRVIGKTLKRDHCTLHLDSGEVCRVTAGGRVVGMFFNGKGRLEYQSEFQLELPAAKYNLERSGSRPTPELGRVEARPLPSGFGITEPITTALVLASGMELPVFDGVAGGNLQGAFAAHRAAFGPLRDRPLEHLVEMQRLNVGAGPVMTVEAQGVHDLYRYILDRAESQTESLSFAVTRYFGVQKMTVPVVVSIQPIGWSLQKPIDPPWTLTHVDLKVMAGSGSSVQVTAKETVQPTIAGLRALRFNLLDEKLEWRSDKSFQHPYKVRRVLGPDGQGLAFWHHRNELLVDLGKSLGTAPIQITFEMEGEILFNEKGDSYWLLGVEPWFPQPDMGGQHYTVRAAISVPAPWIPIAGGRTLRRGSERDRNILEVSIDNPVQFFTVAGGAYRLLEETRQGQTVRVASYVNSGTKASRLMETVFGVLRYYEGFLGGFPFRELTVMQIRDWGMGQAPPGLVLLSNEAFEITEDDGGFTQDPVRRAISDPFEVRDNSGVSGRSFARGTTARVAHEIAHQYWGHAVKMPSEEEQWVTESFAEYSSALALRMMKRQGEGAYKAAISAWKVNASTAAFAAPIPMANRLRVLEAPEVGERARTFLLYDKGALILHTLHREMGDKAFFIWLRSIQANFAWRQAFTVDLEKLASMAARKDMSPLFQAYYWGTMVPK